MESYIITGQFRAASKLHRRDGIFLINLNFLRLWAMLTTSPIRRLKPMAIWLSGVKFAILLQELSQCTNRME